MKFSTIFLAGITSTAQTDDIALSTLTNLKKISLKIISSESINKRDQWKAKWTEKFLTNSARMHRSFALCGTKHDEADKKIHIEYDIENPCVAIKELMTGFSDWTNRYIASCQGQKRKSHQKKRIQKWSNMLNKGNRFELKLISIYDSGFPKFNIFCDNLNLSKL